MFSAYPSPEEAMRTPGKVLLRVRRALRSIISLLLYFLISLTVVVLLNVFLRDLPFVSTGLLRLIAIVPLFFFLDIFRRYYDEITHLERHKITQYRGRISLKYEVPSVKYIDIRTIQVDQDIFGRILNYGNVLIGTAGKDGYELEIHGVPSPSELQHFIEHVRDVSIRTIAERADEGQSSNKSQRFSTD